MSESVCGCGVTFNPLLPMALYGNEFRVGGVLCCPGCTKELLDMHLDLPRADPTP